MLWNKFGQVIQKSSTLSDIPRSSRTINILKILINIGLLNELRIGNNSRIQSKKPNVHSLI